jgi:F-type H+-transporting ATPase subunit a
MDSHEFHILTYHDKEGKKHDVSVPLPVILWTENGLVTFMSSEFKHKDDGSVPVTRKEQVFVKYHGDIYYADSNKENRLIELDASNHPTNQQPTDLSITKLVFSMFLSIFIIVILFRLSARSYAKSKNGEPVGIAKFTEPIILFIKDDVATPFLGEEKAPKYAPFLLTLFFFIWINNIMGLIPIFPFSANLSGNIAFTGILALITFVITTIVANKDYWKHIFWMPGVPVPMKLFLAPIEFLGIFIKPVSLMIRLFANISGGHIIVLSLISLIFIFKSLWLAPASIFFSVFIYIIEVLVIAIQAYIFTMLTALYIGSAMEEHEH